MPAWELCAARRPPARPYRCPRGWSCVPYVLSGSTISATGLAVSRSGAAHRRGAKPQERMGARTAARVGRRFRCEAGYPAARRRGPFIRRLRGRSACPVQSSSVIDDHIRTDRKSTTRVKLRYKSAGTRWRGRWQKTSRLDRQERLTRVIRRSGLTWRALIRAESASGYSSRFRRFLLCRHQAGRAGLPQRGEGGEITDREHRHGPIRSMMT